MVAHCLFQSDNFFLASFSFSNVPTSKAAFNYHTPYKIGGTHHDFTFVTSEKSGSSIVALNQDTVFLEMKLSGYGGSRFLTTWFSSV